MRYAFDVWGCSENNGRSETDIARPERGQNYQQVTAEAAWVPLSHIRCLEGTGARNGYTV